VFSSIVDACRRDARTPGVSFRAVFGHPRLSVNSISSYQQPLSADLALWRDLGVEHVALILPKIEEVGWDAAREMVTGAGLRVSTIFGPTYRPLDADRGLGWWDEDQQGTVDTVEFAASIGAASVYVCSGGAPTLTFDEAADAFCKLIAPAVARGDELGVPVLLEPTNPLRIDISFVLWQRDAMDVARQAGTKVMLDLQSCWYERGLEPLVHTNIDLVGLTQISDFVIGTSQTGDRAVPGDGDIPLERLVAMVLDAGFEGSFDLEVMGPRVEEEGYHSSVRRSVERASELLDRLGA
jgi:sugar phosphate isomerase/epimerase